ncbi:MAG: DUF1015 family protein [Gemmatimonadales bacterium]
MSSSNSKSAVAPFVGYRFQAGDRLQDLIAPPYDVISVEERGALAERNIHNIVHLILPAGDEDKYERAGKLFAKWLEQGVLQPDSEESVYVVQQDFTAPGGGVYTRTGVIGAVLVEPMGTGVVKPHEKTHAGPKQDRLALMRATGAMFEALLMLAPDDDGKLQQGLVEVTGHRPLVECELNGVDVRLWRVSAVEGRKLAEAAGCGPLYMADGHHRYETAGAYMDEAPGADRTLALVVPVGDPGLKVLPTHRVIYGDRIDIDPFIDELRERFHLRELSSEENCVAHLADLKDRGTACVVVRPSGNALALLLKGGASLGDLPFVNEPAVASLDVARVDEMIVKRLLHMAGSEAWLGYSADPDALIGEIARGEAAAGVLLNPTDVDQVLAVADAGAVMPQKATYFLPKVPSGLVTLKHHGS